jgi:hypothetical protein
MRSVIRSLHSITRRGKCQYDVARHRREPGRQTSESVASTIKFVETRREQEPEMGRVMLDLLESKGRTLGYCGDYGSVGTHGDEVSEVENNV